MSRTRLFIIVILFLSIGVGAFWLFSSKGPLSNDLATPLGLTLGILSLLIGFLSFIPLLLPKSSDTEKLETDRAAKKLFIALKQRRSHARDKFDFAKLRAIIPLTLRIEDSPDPAAKSVIDMFHEHQNLLIVGKPGSGKTMSLQQLTLDLLDKEFERSKANEQANSLAVFLHLDTWAIEKKRFEVWLTQQLGKIRLDSSLIQYGLSNGSFVLLLDGLDEMSKEDSKKCLEAIDKFRKETRTQCPFVISCRLDRYRILRGRKRSLNPDLKEVFVEDPGPEKSLDYLTKAGAGQTSHFFNQEEEKQRLSTIADTPNMLHILAQTYPDAPNPDAPNWQPPVDISKKELMEGFVNSSLARYESHVGDDRDHFDREEIRYWLTRLAARMDDKLYFYFRPDNLPGKTAKSLYVISTWLFIFLPSGAALLLLSLAKFPLWQLLRVVALIAGLYGYLVKFIATGLAMPVLYILTFITPFYLPIANNEKTRLQRGWELLTTEVIILLPFMLLLVIAVIWSRAIGVTIWLGILLVCLLEGLFWYTLYRLKIIQRLPKFAQLFSTWLEIVYSMDVNIIEPLSPDKLSPKIGVVIGVAIGLVVWMCAYFIWRMNLLPAAILIGISALLAFGAGAAIRRYLLRFCSFR